MAKFKIRKSIAKRFKITGSGKVTAGRSFTNHLRRNKSKSAKRRLNIPQVMEGKLAIKIKKMLGL